MENSASRYRRRRSCLYVPGSNNRALEKAKLLEADTLILDLEDAVSPDEKEAARQNLLAVIVPGAYKTQEVIVRINGLDTDWAEQDLAAVADIKPDGILLPKVSEATDIIRLDKMVSDAGLECQVWAMIETPLALLNIKEIASSASTTRLSALVVGTNDLAVEYFAVPTPDSAAFQYALSVTLLGARSYGLAAIDGVFNDIRDADGFRKECQAGYILGFDGKTLIHPNQIATCNECFSPSTEELEKAKAIIEAFALEENTGKGVLKVGGAMVERLHLKAAKRLMSLVDEEGNGVK